MPKKNNVASVTPKPEPKTTSKPTTKVKPKVTSESEPKTKPERTPKNAPIITPVTTSEISTISIYSLPDWDADHSTSPHRYGNGGKSFGEFHTEGDAKDWLRRNGYEGHFAAAERIKGKFVKSWHIEIELWEDDAGNDFEMLDEDDLDDNQLSNPDVVRAKIENARLKAELKALSQNGGHSSIVELLQGYKLLNEMQGQGTPQKSLAEQLRELKEVNEIISPPRREPQHSTPQLSDDAVILNALAKNEGIAGKVKDLVRGIFSDKGDKEEITFADVAMEAVKNGELAKTVEAAVNGLGSLVLSMLPRQQHAAPPMVEQPMQAHSQMPQGSAPHAQADNLVSAAVERLIGHILPAMDINDDVIPANNALVSFCDLFPEHAPMINSWMRAQPEYLLALLAQATPQAEAIVSKPHAADWVKRLQTTFLTDEPEEGDDETAGTDASQTGGQHV